MIDINCLISQGETDKEKEDNGSSPTIAALLKSRDF